MPADLLKLIRPFRCSPRMRRGRHATVAAAAVESLEARVVPAVSSVGLSGVFLVVRADDAGSNVEVSAVGADVRVSEVGTGRSWSYAARLVAAVDFRGGNGDDRLVNRVPTLPVRAYGAGGNDDLEGGDAADCLDGGAGNDRLVGNGGGDGLYGGTGDDVLLGGAGNDFLFGQDGNDRLNGGSGGDWLLGGNGDDVLVAIDGVAGDIAVGGDGADTIWSDWVGWYADGLYGTVAERLQAVTGFVNGADRSLDGDRIADPAVTAGQTYRRFAGNPLFSSAGPSMDDVRQGYLGDCYLMAALAAMAKDQPDVLRGDVADFDDGTYGVCLGGRFYRVDDDLPVSATGGTSPAYADLGDQRSMWVAVYEKAFAYYRYGTNSYASIEGGWSVEVNRAFGSASAGSRTLAGYPTAWALADDLAARTDRGEAVTIGFLWAKPGATADAPLIMSHMYTVARVVKDSSGVVTGIVLRNPWGIDGTGNDDDRWDGLVTVTPSQLLDYVGQVNWGRV